MDRNESIQVPLFNQIIGKAVCADQSLNQVSLDFDQRQRSRLRIVIDDGPLAGNTAGIDLPRGTVLRNETVLIDESGHCLIVLASKEQLTEVTAADESNLVQLAYHLGNRHVPVQILNQCLRIRPDHVLEQMVLGLGADTATVTAAFDPEGGAYGGGHSHSHGHDHDHDHDDDHEHGHSHGPRDLNHAPRIHDLSDPDAGNGQSS